MSMSRSATDDNAADKSGLDDNKVARQIPQGIVLGKDGKPCRTCTSFAAWASNTKKDIATPRQLMTPTSSQVPNRLPPHDCPPDVEVLGRSSWTLLHSIAAQYPEQPSPQEQTMANGLITSLSKLYPCWSCATDFQEWLQTDGNAPRVSSRGDFGQWMCEAHNEVNKKLGKPVFDCSKWEQRWRTGWSDGRCD